MANNKPEMCSSFGAFLFFFVDLLTRFSISAGATILKQKWEECYYFVLLWGVTGTNRRCCDKVLVKFVFKDKQSLAGIKKQIPEHSTHHYMECAVPHLHQQHNPTQRIPWDKGSIFLRLSWRRNNTLHSLLRFIVFPQTVKQYSPINFPWHYPCIVLHMDGIKKYLFRVLSHLSNGQHI